MKSILFQLLLIALFPSVIPAQAPPRSASSPKLGARVRIKANANAVVTITNGTASTAVDLSSDIPGCLYIGAELRSYLRKRGCEAPPASFRLIDSTVKDGETFVVLFSDASGGCNVCGRCGGANSSSLIWIRLKGDFSIADKKVVIVEECTDQIGLVEPSWPEPSENGEEVELKFVFRNGRMVVKYEQDIWGNRGVTSTVLSTLVYDKANPALGFVVRKRTRRD